MKNPQSLFILLLLSLFFTACDSDKENTEIVPNAEAEMARTLSYIYGEPKSSVFQNYSKYSVETYASLDNERLNIAFDVPTHVGPDVIAFSIDKQLLQVSYTGNYSLKSLSNPAGTTNVQYVYRKNGTSANMYISNSSSMQGEFNITNYDEKHKLLSGTFELKIENTFDPTAEQINQTDLRRCDITVTGSFENIRIVN